MEDQPGYVEYNGPRSATEVFMELRSRLEATGYLPDEYFLLDSRWENGADFPRDAVILCNTDYGASEGIYTDIALRYEDESGKMITKKFATGKTLGESSLAMDRMHLTASAIMKAFHSDGIHARYIRMGDPEPEDSMLLHLSAGERELVTESLLHERELLMLEGQPYDMAKNLMRRMVGNITEYLQTYGSRPLTMDDYDAAALAVRDSDLKTFHSLCSGIPERHGELLIHAAGHPAGSGSR